MSDQQGPEFDIMEAIERASLSVDRLVLLVYSPKLTLAGWTCEDLEDRFFCERRDLIKEFVTKFDAAMMKAEMYDDGSMRNATEIYLYHRRVKGFDIQMGARYGIREKMTEEGYIEAFGTEEDKERGYMFQYYEPDYNVRIEFNPNKQSMDDVRIVLKAFGGMQRCVNWGSLLKVSRIDLAVDYPHPIDPMLISCRHSRKSFIALGVEGVETVNFGARRSKYVFCIYDKKRELREQQNTLYAGEYLWRIELRCMQTFGIDEMVNFVKLWERLDVFHGGVETGNWIIDLMIFKAKHCSMRGVLGKLPKQTAHDYKALLRGLEKEEIEHPADVYCGDFKGVWLPIWEKIKDVFNAKDPAEFPKNVEPFDEEALFCRPDLNRVEIPSLL